MISENALNIKMKKRNKEQRTKKGLFSQQKRHLMEFNRHLYIGL
jgi:hypothetical protein